jgi:hypothetical protein
MIIGLTAIVFSFFPFSPANTLCRIRAGNTKLSFCTAVERLPGQLGSCSFGSIEQVRYLLDIGFVFVVNQYLLIIVLL